MEFGFNSKIDELWTEKFRANTFDEIILPERLKNVFRKFVKQGSIKNIMLISPSPGTGKTSIAKILIRELQATCLFLNGSQDNGIGIIRGPITNFVQNSSATGQKIIFIDESDGLTIDAQDSLKSFVEDNANICRFILTANDEYAFTPAMRSRFTRIYFNITDDEYKDMVNQFINRVCTLLDGEGVEYDAKAVFQIVKDSYPDYRDAWQVLEGTYLSYGKIVTAPTASKKAIISIIEAIDSKNIDNVRKAMSNVQNINYKKIYSQMFQNIDMFKNLEKNNLIFSMANWQYKNSFVADKFLNFIGFVSDVYLND